VKNLKETELTTAPPKVIIHLDKAEDFNYGLARDLTEEAIVRAVWRPGDKTWDKPK